MSIQYVSSANHSSLLLPLAHIDDNNMKRSSRTSLSLRVSMTDSFKRTNYFIFNEVHEIAINRRTIKKKLLLYCLWHLTPKVCAVSQSVW